MPEILTNVWTFIYAAGCVTVAIVAGIVLIRDSRDRRERMAEVEAKLKEETALEAARLKAHKNYVAGREAKRAQFCSLPHIDVEEADEGSWYDAKLAAEIRAAVEEKSALDDVIVR